jgi:hypothetical protein
MSACIPQSKHRTNVTPFVCVQFKHIFSDIDAIENVNSAWIRRRLVIVKDGQQSAVYFLRPSPETNAFVDRVPMSEIKNIFRKIKKPTKDTAAEEKRMGRPKHTRCGIKCKKSKSGTLDGEDSSSSEGEEDDGPLHHHDHHEFQIETFDDETPVPGSTGECAGRTYHFRIADKKKCKQTVKKIKRISQKVRADAERKSRFQQAQSKVLRYYESRPFQFIVGLLILAVIYPPHSKYFFSVPHKCLTCLCHRISHLTSMRPRLIYMLKRTIRTIQFSQALHY